MLFVVVAYRFATCSVATTDDGVKVRGVWRNYELPWSEIDHFQFGGLGLNPAIGSATTTNGEQLPLGVLQSSPLWRRAVGEREAEWVVALLNERLDHERQP